VARDYHQAKAPGPRSARAARGGALVCCSVRDSTAHSAARNDDDDCRAIDLWDYQVRSTAYYSEGPTKSGGGNMTTATVTLDLAHETNL
jgi:hypothetical protein